MPIAFAFLPNLDSTFPVRGSFPGAGGRGLRGFIEESDEERMGSKMMLAALEKVTPITLWSSDIAHFVLCATSFVK